MTPPDFLVWVKRSQSQAELQLERVLPAEGEFPPILHEAMRYAVLGGGKRIRAMLAMAAAQIGEADEDALAQTIAAVELIHAYSLVHDDLPAMDNDTLRRGKPTCHIAYGEANALLVGDALQTLAFEVLAQENTLPPQQRLSAYQRLAQACGSRGMTGGQFVDLNQIGKNPSQNELETMHYLKTGALIEASVQLGYLSCREITPDIQAALHRYALALGLAFQVVDDILDHEADSATLGKTAGKDAQNHKPTFVSLLGVQLAKNYAQKLHQTAIASLSTPSLSAESSSALRYLADFVVERRY